MIDSMLTLSAEALDFLDETREQTMNTQLRDDIYQIIIRLLGDELSAKAMDDDEDREVTASMLSDAIADELEGR